MSTAEHSRSVVVGVDGSPASAAAVEWAAAVAGRDGWSLTLVHAYPDLNSPPVRGFYVPEHEMRVDARKITDAVKESLTDAGWGPDDIATEVDRGYPADVLASHSRNANMLVVGRRGRGGFLGMLIGSTAFSAVEHARVPTVIVPDTWSVVADDNRPVVIGLAETTGETAAVDFAFDAASRGTAPLHAIYAFDPMSLLPRTPPLEGSAYPQWKAERERGLAEELAGWADTYPDVPVDRRVVVEHPVHALLEQSSKAQLLVVGGRRQPRLPAALLGSTSRSVMHHAGCPLAVVHERR
jgi:nucleotide-binding universal stress UspA family protein